MKHNAKLSVLSVLLLFVYSATVYGTDPAKRALIIAVGKYKNLSALSSAADVTLLKRALQIQQFTSVDTLVNEQATKQAMISSIKKLTAQTRPGDIVLLHFSAHGQQVQDLSGDEPDGLDETTCAYDALSFYSPDFGLSGNLLDDELGELLDALRIKAGKTGEVFVTLDACYSGSGTRGDAIARGGYEPMMINKAAVTLSPQNNSGMDDGTGRDKAANENDAVAPLVVFSGARSYEKNYEYKGHGSLSFALSEVLANTEGKISYEGLFGRVQSVMARIAPYQHPVAEGTGLQNPFLGGKPVTQLPYYRLFSVNPEEKTITIVAGTLAGINDSSVIRFYAPGTTDPKNTVHLTEGIVTGSDALYTTVSVPAMPTDFAPENAWAFLHEMKFSRTMLAVKIKDFRDKSAEDNIKSFVTSLRFAGPVALTEPQSDLWIEPGSATGTYTVKDAQSGAVYRPGVKGTEELEKTLREFARSKVMRELNLKHKAIAVTAELIPVTVDIDKGEITDTLKPEIRIENGTFTAKEGEYYLLKLTNTGRMPAFVNVVNIMADSVRLLLPDPEENQSVANMQITGEYIVPGLVYTFSPRAGETSSREILKVIATEKPIDLKSVFTSTGKKGAGKRSVSNPLEEIVNYALDVSENNSVTTRSAGTNRTTTTELVINVVKQ